MRSFCLSLFFLISLSAFSQEKSETLALIIAPDSSEEFDYDGIHIIVETMPVFTKECAQETSGEEEYQCSKKAIQEYGASTEYPEQAVDFNIEGKVYISFVVDSDGKVIDVKLLKGVHKILDQAVLEHFKKMPRFYKPGKQRGKNVKVKFSIPINFKLDDEDQRENIRELRIQYEKEKSINLVRLLPKTNYNH